MATREQLMRIFGEPLQEREQLTTKLGLQIKAIKKDLLTVAAQVRGIHAGKASEAEKAVQKNADALDQLVQVVTDAVEKRLKEV